LSRLDCESCQLGKHSRTSFPHSVTCDASSPFALVHFDIWGPRRIKSTLGFKYVVTFIDDYSICSWLFLMIIPYVVFESTCFVHNFSLGLDKLSPRSHKCVFLRFTRSQKGYKCFSPFLNCYFVPADVTYTEFSLYFKSQS